MGLSDKKYAAFFQVREMSAGGHSRNFSYIVLLDSHAYCITMA